MTPERLKESLKAVLVALVTPFRKDGEVDVEGLRQNTSFLVDSCHGRPAMLFTTGSTGEFYALSREEYELVVSTVIDESNGRLPVIVGAAQAGTKETLVRCRYAEDAGADGVMVVLPFYHVPDEEGMLLHYKTITESVGIGVMVYNNPDTTKCYIQPRLMEKLADIPGISGVKENTKDIELFNSMMKIVGKKMPVLCGLGELYFSLTALLGCQGFVSALANFAPKISLDILSAAKGEDFKSLRELVSRLEPFYEFMTKINLSHSPSTTVLPKPYMEHYFWLAAVKGAMDVLGLRGGAPRLPLVGLTEREGKELVKVLEGMGIKRSDY